jgi:hypothetical protein
MRLIPQKTKSTNPTAWLIHTRLGTTVVVAGRGARHAARPIRRAATDSKVQGETRRAAESASKAARRVRRVGVTRALSDRRVAREVRRSTHHVSRAANLALHPRKSHRGRNAAIVAASALVGGTAYAGYRTATSRGGAEEASPEVAE